MNNNRINFKDFFELYSFKVYVDEKKEEGWERRRKMIYQISRIKVLYLVRFIWNSNSYVSNVAIVRYWFLWNLSFNDVNVTITFHVKIFLTSHSFPLISDKSWPISVLKKKTREKILLPYIPRIKIVGAIKLLSIRSFDIR